MNLLEHIPKDIWNGRLGWLESIEESARNPMASYLLSPKATLLTYDLYRSYCSGAWISVIILCHSAIDATIRDTEIGDYKSNSKTVFGDDLKLEWLRKKRNQLVHVSENEPREVDDFDLYHDSLQEDAQKAVKLLFDTIYGSPGT